MSDLHCVCGNEVPDERIDEVLERGGACSVCGTFTTAKAFDLSRAPVEIGSDCWTCGMRVKKANPHRMDAGKFATLRDLGVASEDGLTWVACQQDLQMLPDGASTPLKTVKDSRVHVQRLYYYGVVDYLGRRTGKYRINERGLAFLRGESTVPAVIYCRGGRVLADSPKRVAVTEIKDVILDKAYWDRYPRSEA